MSLAASAGREVFSVLPPPLSQACRSYQVLTIHVASLASDTIACISVAHAGLAMPNSLCTECSLRQREQTLSTCQTCSLPSFFSYDRIIALREQVQPRSP